MKKKKHTGLKIFLVFLLILVVAATVLFIRFYPAYRDAGFVKDNLNLQCFSYELRVKLDAGTLQEKYVKLLDTLSELTGTERESMYDLTVKGSVDKDIIHAYIYTGGDKEPFLELYLSDGANAVNGEAFYSRVRSHYAAQNPALALFIPVWEDHEYMTLSQMENMLDVDLSEIKKFRLGFTEQGFSRQEYFLALGLMHREKEESGCVYGLSKEGVNIEFALDYEEKTVILNRAEVDHPAELVAKLSDMLSKVGVELHGEKLEVFDNVSVALDTASGGGLKVPEDYISEQTVEIIRVLRQL